MEIDKKRCTIVFFPQKSMKIVVLSFKIIYIKNGHSVAEVPKKVEKTSSGNTTFANSEHPYRTSGLSAGYFDEIVVATSCY